MTEKSSTVRKVKFQVKSKDSKSYAKPREHYKFYLIEMDEKLWEQVKPLLTVKNNEKWNEDKAKKEGYEFKETNEEFVLPVGEYLIRAKENKPGWMFPKNIEKKCNVKEGSKIMNLNFAFFPNVPKIQFRVRYDYADWDQEMKFWIYILNFDKLKEGTKKFLLENQIVDTEKHGHYYIKNADTDIIPLPKDKYDFYAMNHDGSHTSRKDGERILVKTKTIDFILKTKGAGGGGGGSSTTDLSGVEDKLDKIRKVIAAIRIPDIKIPDINVTVPTNFNVKFPDEIKVKVEGLEEMLKRLSIEIKLPEDLMQLIAELKEAISKIGSGSGAVATIGDITNKIGDINIEAPNNEDLVAAIKDGFNGLGIKIDEMIKELRNFNIQITVEGIQDIVGVLAEIGEIIKNQNINRILESINSSLGTIYQAIIDLGAIDVKFPDDYEELIKELIEAIRDIKREVAKGGGGINIENNTNLSELVKIIEGMKGEDNNDLNRLIETIKDGFEKIDKSINELTKSINDSFKEFKKLLKKIIGIDRGSSDKGLSRKIIEKLNEIITLLGRDQNINIKIDFEEPLKGFMNELIVLIQNQNCSNDTIIILLEQLISEIGRNPNPRPQPPQPRQKSPEFQYVWWNYSHEKMYTLAFNYHLSPEDISQRSRSRERFTNRSEIHGETTFTKPSNMSWENLALGACIKNTNRWKWVKAGVPEPAPPTRNEEREPQRREQGNQQRQGRRRKKKNTTRTITKSGRSCSWWT